MRDTAALLVAGEGKEGKKGIFFSLSLSLPLIPPLFSALALGAPRGRRTAPQPPMVACKVEA